MMKDQLALLNNFNKEFGGQWTMQVGGNHYEIEAVNSPRILGNPDSINLYVAVISTRITKEIPNFKPWLVLNVTKETKAGLLTSSTSVEYTFNLDYIKLFEDKPLKELSSYVIAGIAVIKALDEDPDSATILKMSLDSLGFRKDYLELIDFVIRKEKGLVTDIGQFAANLSGEEKNKILHVGAISYMIKSDLVSALKFIRPASIQDPKNTYYQMKYGEYCFREKVYTEAASLFTNVIKQDPENLRAWHSRAWSNFKMGKEAEGCEDINQMYVIKPEVNMPDSTKVICQIN
ncbi:MAG: hypothetical protein AAFQ94_28170 [Bacteroidota bacterium]